MSFHEFFRDLRARKRAEQLAELKLQSEAATARYNNLRRAAALAQAALADLINQFSNDKRLAGNFVLTNIEEPKLGEIGAFKVRARHENMLLEFEVVADVDQSAQAESIVVSFRARRWDLLDTECEPYYVEVQIRDGGVSVSELYDNVARATVDFINRYV
jgi:hypothetical protein